MSNHLNEQQYALQFGGMLEWCDENYERWFRIKENRFGVHFFYNGNEEDSASTLPELAKKLRLDLSQWQVIQPQQSHLQMSLW